MVWQPRRPQASYSSHTSDIAGHNQQGGNQAATALSDRMVWQPDSLTGELWLCSRALDIAAGSRVTLTLCQQAATALVHISVCALGDNCVR